jgi:hypothetical protein
LPTLAGPQHYDFPLKQEEINIDYLGSIEVMTEFLLRRKGIVDNTRH